MKKRERKIKLASRVMITFRSFWSTKNVFPIAVKSAKIQFIRDRKKIKISFFTKSCVQLHPVTTMGRKLKIVQYNGWNLDKLVKFLLCRLIDWLIDWLIESSYTLSFSITAVITRVQVLVPLQQESWPMVLLWLLWA